MGKIIVSNLMPLLFPVPTVLVGANVDDKSNFMACSCCGLVNARPLMIAVGIRPRPYTYKGIKQNIAFSVNVPSTDMVREVDYCGITSGSKVDKVKVCQFNVFYGKLGNVPLIEQCPVNLECDVVHILGLGSHSLIIGKIEEIHISETCLTDGKPDVDKIEPLMGVSAPVPEYYAFGRVVGKAFDIGRELIKE